MLAFSWSRWHSWPRFLRMAIFKVHDVLKVFAALSGICACVSGAERPNLPLLLPASLVAESDREQQFLPKECVTSS